MSSTTTKTIQPSKNFIIKISTPRNGKYIEILNITSEQCIHVLESKPDGRVNIAIGKCLDLFEIVVEEIK